MRRLLLAGCLLALPAFAADGGGYVRIPGGNFVSAIKFEDVRGAIKVKAFELMRQPVTNAEFATFVRRQPKWQRNQIAPVFAGPDYLAHWSTPTLVAAGAQGGQPVTRVSWFAAAAYCEAQGARLPTWIEWEYVAAADQTRRDARADPVWRERILGWYARPSSQPLPRAGAQPPNVFGVRDLHGVVWEWTDDYSAMLMAADNRNQDDPDQSRFCGAGALSIDDRENYAVLMRVAMLSSLEGSYTTMNLGFRCAREVK